MSCAALLLSPEIPPPAVPLPQPAAVAPAPLLVIGDLHQPPNLPRIEAAIRRAKPRRTIFLGDYFDQWDDEPADAGRTAAWLKSSLAKPDRVHLFGNHDLAYAFPELNTCPGFTTAKHAQIKQHLGAKDWAKLQLAHWEDGFLFTHAGWSRQNCPAEVTEPTGHLQEQIRAAWRDLRAGRWHWVWSVGRSRGGRAPAGGLLWCDVFAEFQPIPGISQVFGHTPTGSGWRVDGENSVNWCIDTARRTGPTHYLVIQDGVAQLKTFPGVEPPWRGVLP